MHQQRRTTWEYLFVGSPRDQREEKVLSYVLHRMKAGGRLKDVVKEEYVRRNASEEQVDEVICNPELVHAARENMESALKSEAPSVQTPSR